MMMKPWQALLNKAPSTGGRDEQRERTQVPARSVKPERWSQRGKGTYYVPQPPGVLRSKLEEERKQKPENTVKPGRALNDSTSQNRSSPRSLGSRATDTLNLQKACRTTKGGPPVPFADHAMLAHMPCMIPADGVCFWGMHHQIM
jgi:hypothetical protein